MELRLITEDAVWTATLDDNAATRTSSRCYAQPHAARLPGDGEGERLAEAALD